MTRDQRPNWKKAGIRVERECLQLFETPVRKESRISKERSAGKSYTPVRPPTQRLDCFLMSCLSRAKMRNANFRGRQFYASICRRIEIAPPPLLGIPRVELNLRFLFFYFQPVDALFSRIHLFTRRLEWCCGDKSRRLQTLFYHAFGWWLEKKKFHRLSSHLFNWILNYFSTC